MRIQSDNLTVEFHAGRNVALSCIADERAGHDWLAPFPDTGTLWRLRLAGPDGTAPEMKGPSGYFAGSELSGGALTLAWRLTLGGGAECHVRVRIAPHPTEPGLSLWSLEADLPPDWTVLRVDFPVIPNIALAGDLRLIAPVGWGFDQRMRPGAEYEGTYPSCLAVMQFLAFTSGSRGLYIATHDPRGCHKEFRVRAGDDAVCATVVHWPALPAAGGGRFALPYETVVGVFSGDWWDAAQIYRRFTFAAPWGSGGSIAERVIPDWLRTTDLWLRPRGTPEDNLPPTITAMNYFGVPAALHWYDWHEIPYDTLYPEYFPPKPGFREAVAELQRRGAHVMPYINGRLWDPAGTSWQHENAAAAAARADDGRLYTEVYGSRVPLNVMCPSTGLWHDTVDSLVKHLTKQLAVDGVYIDQIAAAPAVRCHAVDHGHPPGGGHFWHDGYRQMLDRVRAGLPPERILTSEENAECWIDQLDALLVVNTHTDETVPLPLFQAVYADRALTFGFAYYPEDDFSNPVALRMKFARCFVWGAQLGWICPRRIMEPALAREAEFLRSLARVRRHAREFLCGGRFMGLLDTDASHPRVRGEGAGSFGGRYQIDLPAVLGSVWQHDDGRVAVLLANQSTETCECDVELPATRLAHNPTAHWNISVHHPDDTMVRVKHAPFPLHVPLRSLSGTVLILSPG